LHPIGRALSKALNAALTERGVLPLDFYPDFIKQDDPASGFNTSAYDARFSTGYWALHNRFAVLVETHSWKDYPTRVRVTHDAVVALSDMMARDGKSWRALTLEADERAMRLGGQDVVLSYEDGPHFTIIDFRGYAYTREPSATSGALVTRYDPTKPQIWRVPLYDTVNPKITVHVPRGGYLVPPAHAAWVAERLAVHGIVFDRIPKAAQNAPVEVFRASAVTFSKEPFETHSTAELIGQWQPENRDLPAGSLFVPIAQPNARLVLALLEPRSPDSYAAWGFFNGAFEQKEYMEPYVAEQVAGEMLHADPELAAAFKKRLAEDAEFAKDPSARLDFFYRRHPSWDERYNLYPVYRTQGSSPH
jgi:hypothetical protein